MPSHRRDAVAPRCLVDPIHHPINTARERGKEAALLLTNSHPN